MTFLSSAIAEEHTHTHQRRSAVDTSGDVELRNRGLLAQIGTSTIASHVMRVGRDGATARERQDSDGMQGGEEDDIPSSCVHAPKDDGLQVVQVPYVTT